MKRLNKLVVLLLLFVMVLSGCSSNTPTTNNTNSNNTVSSNSKVDNGVTVLKFKDTITPDELKKLDGKKVQITGFIGGASPLDGSYIYLMNMPYQNCAFCIPSDNNLGNTIAAYPSKGKTIDYTDTPVTVTGVLTFGAMTDKVGYSYEYSLQNVEVKKADVSGLEKEVQIYQAIVDKGLVVKYNEIAGLIFEKTSTAKMGAEVDFKSLTPISSDAISGLRKLLDGLNSEDYTEVIAVIDTLEDSVNLVNEGIELENKDSLIRGYDLAESAYALLYFWLIKPEL